MSERINYKNASRLFSVSVPSVWNLLKPHLHSIDFLGSLKIPPKDCTLPCSIYPSSEPFSNFDSFFQSTCLTNIMLVFSVVQPLYNLCANVRSFLCVVSQCFKSHHALYDICLLILVGAPSATALLQHGITVPPPSKIVRPSIVSSAT